MSQSGPKRAVEDAAALQAGVPEWVAEGVLADDPDTITQTEAFTQVLVYGDSTVNRDWGLRSGAVASVAEYTLTAQPQAIAANTGAGRVTYVVENRTGLASGELLGENQSLGQGVTIGANEKSSFDLPGMESIYAAAPTADGVVLRVLSFRAA